MFFEIKNRLSSLLSTNFGLKFLDWFEVALLVTLALFFIFPKVETTCVFLVFPLIWILRWIVESRGGEEKSGCAGTVIDLALLVLCIQLLVSTLVSGNIWTGLPKISGIIFGILVFYALLRVFKSHRLIKAGIVAFLLSGVVLAVIGMIGMIKVKGVLPRKNWGFQGAEQGLNPNAVGGVMMFFVPLMIVLAVWAVVKKRRQNHIVARGIDSVFFSALALYSCLVLFLSQSVWSWGALVLSFWIVVPTLKARFVGSGPAILFLLVVFVVIPGKFDKKTTFHRDKAFWVQKIEKRFKFWNEGLKAVDEKPITGIGVNQLRMRPGFGYENSHAHNQMIHTAAELGIPGLIAYLAILMGAGYMWLEVWRKTSIGWMKASAQGLGAGQIAFFIFGLGDAIPLGAKPGIFFWVSLALIAAMYNFTIQQKLIEKDTEV